MNGAFVRGDEKMLGGFVSFSRRGIGRMSRLVTANLIVEGDVAGLASKPGAARVSVSDAHPGVAIWTEFCLRAFDRRHLIDLFFDASEALRHKENVFQKFPDFLKRSNWSVGGIHAASF